MSKIQRLTLISDPTDEFPKNANNSFKVRLPERLSLPGEGWHASLMSLTVPDKGQSNAVIATDPHTKVVKFSVTYLTRKYVTGLYRFVAYKTKDYGVELEDIMSSKQSVTTGSEFWKRVMQEVHNKVMQALLNQQESALTFNADQRPIVSVKKNWMPMMTWKDDVLVLHAIPKEDAMKSDKTATTTTFAMDLGIAQRFGFIEKPAGVDAGYVIGPNLQFTFPTVTYTNQTQPDSTDPAARADYNWNGDHFVAVQPTDLTSDIMDQVFEVKKNRLYLSRVVEWQFNNLNASFEKIVGTSKRTVMVYSDVVESTVVGSGKFPLLREVQLLRTGEGESTAEPLHHQWIKVRGNQLDIIEVEIADTSGPLTILPPGKTIVTIGLKQV